MLLGSNISVSNKRKFNDNSTKNLHSVCIGRKLVLPALFLSASLFLYGFTPAESDLVGLTAEQKAFVSAADWKQISEEVIETVRTGIKNNAARALVLAGCIYQNMEKPHWLMATAAPDYMTRRMLADAIIAQAFDSQVSSQSGKSALGKDFSELMDGIRGKAMIELKASPEQTSVIENLVSRHLLEALNNTKKK